MPKYRYVGDHAAEINGTMMAPGEFCELTAKELEESGMEDSFIAVTGTKKGGDDKDD